MSPLLTSLIAFVCILAGRLPRIKSGAGFRWKTL
jgi:hypothetical protein